MIIQSCVGGFYIFYVRNTVLHNKCPKIDKIIVACCCLLSLVSGRIYELSNGFVDCLEVFFWQEDLL